MFKEVISALPFFEALHDASKNALHAHALVHDVEAGERICEHDGKTCERLAFIVYGRIRVYKMSEAGREVTLYDVIDGEVCLSSLQCLLEGKPYDVHIDTIEPSRIVFIPANLVQQWLLEDSSFLKYLLKSTLQKVDTLMWHYESMSFAPIKQRISLYLYEKSRHFRVNTIYITHQRIADEIGASREAVSRVLKTLEGQGDLKLSRGKIHLNGTMPLY